MNIVGSLLLAKLIPEPGRTEITQTVISNAHTVAGSISNLTLTTNSHRIEETHMRLSLLHPIAIALLLSLSFLILSACGNTSPPKQNQLMMRLPQWRLNPARPRHLREKQKNLRSRRRLPSSIRLPESTAISTGKVSLSSPWTTSNGSRIRECEPMGSSVMTTIRCTLI